MYVPEDYLSRANSYEQMVLLEILRALFRSKQERTTKTFLTIHVFFYAQREGPM